MNLLTNNCFITGLPTQEAIFMSNCDIYEYEININGKKHFLAFSQEFPDIILTEGFKELRPFLAGLLFNDNWIKKEDEPITTLTLEKLKQIVKQRDYPKSPKEKMEFMLGNLYLKYGKIGQRFSVKWSQHPEFYLVDDLEMRFYLNTIERKGFADLKNDEMGSSVLLTYEGLIEAARLEEAGIDTNACFIAMSFSEVEPVPSIRSAIKRGLKFCGYQPILVDEIHTKHDETIDDAIIRNLKKCRFTIADFTFQSKGVYFESGFSIGQGKKVIFTCLADCFNGHSGKSHFDTNHFPHIIYKSPEELELRLIDKIEAWIK